MKTGIRFCFRFTFVTVMAVLALSVAAAAQSGTGTSVLLPTDVEKDLTKVQDVINELESRTQDYRSNVQYQMQRIIALKQQLDENADGSDDKRHLYEQIENAQAELMLMQHDHFSAISGMVTTIIDIAGNLQDVELTDIKARESLENGIEMAVKQTSRLMDENLMLNVLGAYGGLNENEQLLLERHLDASENLANTMSGELSWYDQIRDAMQGRGELETGRLRHIIDNMLINAGFYKEHVDRMLTRIEAVAGARAVYAEWRREFEGLRETVGRLNTLIGNFESTLLEFDEMWDTDNGIMNPVDFTTMGLDDITVRPPSATQADSPSRTSRDYRNNLNRNRSNN